MLIRVVEEDGALSIYIVQSSVSVADSTINDIYIDKRRGFAKPFYSKRRTSGTFSSHLSCRGATYRFLARRPSK
jgi:hypothetical protein